MSVLLSSDVYASQRCFFCDVIDKLQKRLNIKLDINFILHDEQNIIYKLKRTINAEHRKVVFYIDGNKGSFDRKQGASYNFKDHKIIFHEGFGILCWLFSRNKICGIICTQENSELTLQFKFSDLPPRRNKIYYVKSVIEIILQHLETLLNRDNIHQWDALVSVYKWLIFENKKNHKHEFSDYIPFFLDGKYYALNIHNFLVNEIVRKSYYDICERNDYRNI